MEPSLVTRVTFSPSESTRRISFDPRQWLKAAKTVDGGQIWSISATEKSASQPARAAKLTPKLYGSGFLPEGYALEELDEDATGIVTAMKAGRLAGRTVAAALALYRLDPSRISIARRIASPLMRPL